MLLVLLLVVAALAAAVAAEGHAPVIFSPGYGGSDLYMIIKDDESVPAPCVGLGLPVGRSFLAMPSGKGIVMNDACLSALFSLPTPPGIDIFVASFGDFKGISSPYWTIAKTFESWGYTVGKDVFGAPYDYRFMTKAAIAEGYTKSLRALIESAYEKNGNRRALLLAHSNGPPTQYAFLGSMTTEWKDKYIGALISLSGNYRPPSSITKKAEMYGERWRRHGTRLSSRSRTETMSSSRTRCS